jgi:hypothetical protein
MLTKLSQSTSLSSKFARSISFFKRHELSHLKKSLQLPRQTPSSFALYYKDQYAKSGLKEQVAAKTMKIEEAVKISSQKWNSESEAVRQAYQETAHRDRETYAEQKASCLERLNGKQQLLLQTLKELPKASQFRLLPEEVQKFLMQIPRAPPAAGKLLFVREQYKEHSGKPFNANESASFMSEIIQKWNALDEGAKMQYKQKAQMLWKQYKSELASFLNK